jgi:hypothetical protein
MPFFNVNNIVLYYLITFDLSALISSVIAQVSTLTTLQHDPKMSIASPGETSVRLKLEDRRMHLY